MEEEYFHANTSVWWDIENCQVPRGIDGNAIARNIRSALCKMRYRGRVSIAAYGDTHRLPSTVQHALSSTGIDLNHVPSGVKDAADKMILVNMLLWAIDNPAPANIFLISGDRDFSNALHQLSMKRYNILLARPKDASAPLVAAAKNVWLWTNLVAGGPPTKSKSIKLIKDTNLSSPKGSRHARNSTGCYSSTRESENQNGGWSTDNAPNVNSTKRSSSKKHGSKNEVASTGNSSKMGGSASALIKDGVSQSYRRKSLSEKEYVIETMNGILNNMTPENYEFLAPQIVESGIKSADTLKGVLHMIFDKIVLEPTFCPMYAQLCSYIIEKMPSFPLEEPGSSIITSKKVLLDMCQKTVEDAIKLKKELKEMTAPEQEMERREKERWLKSRTLGNLDLIGELMKLKILHEMIAHHIIQEFLEHDIEACCHFLKKIGKQLDESPGSRRINDVYFSSLKEQSINPLIAAKLKLMLRELIILRANNWVPQHNEGLREAHTPSQSVSIPSIVLLGVLSFVAFCIFHKKLKM